jgi:hypothetical protein
MFLIAETLNFIAVLKRGEVWGQVLCPMPTEAYAHGGLCPMPARAPHVTEKGYNN